MSRPILGVLLTLLLALGGCAQAGTGPTASTPAPAAASPAATGAATRAPTTTGATAPATPSTSPSPAATPAATPAAAGATATTTGKPAATPGGAAKKVTVALDWYPWANHTGLLMAQERGYFRDEGLDVELYVPANPADGIKLVAAGRDTFAISYQTDVLLARAEDVPVKSVAALVQQPLNSIMTLKESGITSPKQLEGKRVGTAGLPSDSALLKTMVEHDGGDLSKVEQIDVGFDLIPALIGKRVDAVIGAYWVHESILAELEGYPVNVMRVEDYGVPAYYELVVIASDETVAQRADMVRRFLRAASRGYADAAADHAAALDVLVKTNPETNRALEERGLPLLAPLWTKGASAFGEQTAERWTAYADWMKQQGILDKKVAPLDGVALDLTPR